MPSVGSKLTWGMPMPWVYHTLSSLTFLTAIPVKIEELVAHLEAYFRLLPETTASRLGHRYGKEHNAAIAKLPIELMYRIEEHLITEARTYILEDWKLDFNCFQLQCSPLDHFEHSELEEIQQDVLQGNVKWPSNAGRTEDESALLSVYPSNAEDEWIETHSDRSLGWLDNLQTFFTKHGSLIAQHFGISVWYLTARLGVPPTQHYKSRMNLPRETTIAYIELARPNSTSFKHEWRISREDPYRPGLMSQSGYAVAVATCPTLSDTDRTTFNRAMRILGLEPYDEDSTESRNPGATMPAESKIQGMAAWPRMMMLVRAEACIQN